MDAGELRQPETDSFFAYKQKRHSPEMTHHSLICAASRTGY
jgi:hypothetical protein